MATLRDIRRRINSVKSTQQITKAMKMVAASRFRKAQERIQKTRPYVIKLGKMLSNVAASVDHSLNPFLQERETQEHLCFIVVAADRGLCGSFNANVLRRGKNEIDALCGPGKTVSVVPVGRKTHEFFSRRQYTCAQHYMNFFNELQFEHAAVIARFVNTQFLDGVFDRVFLVYTEAVSMVKQNIQVEQLLPIAAAQLEAGTAGTEYIFEPPPQKLLEILCPKTINMKIWRALLESFAAEQAARMVAMDAATDNAEEMINNLRLYYNKVRQAAITKEISEIVGGAEALK